MKTEESQPDSAQEPTLPTPEGRPASEWAERAEKAKEAREEGKKLREGKPILFPTRHAMPGR